MASGITPSSPDLADDVRGGHHIPLGRFREPPVLCRPVAREAAGRKRDHGAGKGRAMARKKVRKDEVFGELTHVVADLWDRPIDLPFLGAVRSVRLSVRIDEEHGIEPQQVKAYRDFVKRTDEYMAKAERAILKYYPSAREDMDIEADDDETMPLIRSVGELAKLVTLEGVHFNYACDVPTFGLLCECTWDEEHGVGVLFERGKVTEVGPQDVVL